MTKDNYFIHVATTISAVCPFGPEIYENEKTREVATTISAVCPFGLVSPTSTTI